MSLYEITTCEHGYEGPQERKHAQSITPGGCRGGERREMEVVDEVMIHSGYAMSAAISEPGRYLVVRIEGET